MRPNWVRSQFTRGGIRFLEWLLRVHGWDDHHGNKGPTLQPEHVAPRLASERKKPRSGKLPK